MPQQSKSFSFKSEVLSANFLAERMRNLFLNWVLPQQIFVNVTKRLSDGSTKQEKSYDIWDSVSDVCDLTRDYVHMSFITESYSPGIQISFMPYDEYFIITISVTEFDMNKVIDDLQTALPLESFVPKKSVSVEDRIFDLERRVRIVEGMSEGKKLRCFLSCRFIEEDPINERYITQVKKFLTLLDVDVETGEEYQPRRIEEKVEEKLRGELDFIVLLVVQSNATEWQRDEIAYNLASHLKVIPLVEEGANFTPGIFGNVEKIGFPREHITEAFLKLIEGVRFIRMERKPNHSLQ